MEKISRTQKKKMALARQRLGERLIALAQPQVAQLNLPPELEEAVDMARRMTKHEARRRQIQYVGKLMRDIDPQQIEAALQSIQTQTAQEARKFKLVEQWRDELVSGSRHRLTWLTNHYAELSEGQLTQLVHQARQSRETAKERQANRRLFRYLMKTLPDAL